jgi:hypothetical protein
MQGIKNVVLVHGAWADGSSWSKLIPLLQAKGLHAVAVQNPLSSMAPCCWLAIPMAAL